MNGKPVNGRLHYVSAAKRALNLLLCSIGFLHIVFLFQTPAGINFGPVKRRKRSALKVIPIAIKLSWRIYCARTQPNEIVPLERNCTFQRGIVDTNKARAKQSPKNENYELRPIICMHHAHTYMYAIFHKTSRFLCRNAITF